MIRIIQISDLHLFGDKDAKFLGVKPYTNLAKVMAMVKADIAIKKPDFIALTGDLSQDCSKESYELVKTLFKDLSVPIYTILGNHDEPKLFNSLCKQIKAKNLSLGNWRIFFLNSHWPNHISGYIDDVELRKLEKAIVQSGEKHILIFLHHHVLPVRSDWLDKINLKNADKLLDVFDNHKNIKLVISGHVHQESFQTRNNIDFITSPATCFQFGRSSEFFSLEPLMPGFRYIDLYDDGSYKTEVVRISYDPSCLPNLESAGY